MRYTSMPGQQADDRAPSFTERKTGQAGRGPAEGCGLVLVAEDEEQLRRGLVRFLTSLGHIVIEAEDGGGTISMALALKPDIVLLDIAMPVKNGLDVLKELVPQMPDTGFIIVTGNEDAELALSCQQLGAFDYVPKPVDLDALAHSIRARLLLRNR